MKLHRWQDTASFMSAMVLAMPAWLGCADDPCVVMDSDLVVIDHRLITIGRH